MSADLPQALASVLSEMEREGAPYVLYRDPKSGERVVLLVEGGADARQIAAVLRSAGAESSANIDDFTLRSSDSRTGRERTYSIEVKVGSAKSTIANLLWRAATHEGAALARKSIDREY